MRYPRYSPVGILADALTMVKQADACLCVVRLNVLPRGVLSSLRVLESEHHVTNCGVLVNGYLGEYTITSTVTVIITTSKIDKRVSYSHVVVSKTGEDTF